MKHADTENMIRAKHVIERVRTLNLESDRFIVLTVKITFEEAVVEYT